MGNFEQEKGGPLRAIIKHRGHWLCRGLCKDSWTDRDVIWTVVVQRSMY